MKTIIRAMLVMAMFGVAANSYAGSTTSTFGNATLNLSLELQGSCQVDLTSGTIANNRAMGEAAILRVTDAGTVTVTSCAAAYSVGAGGGNNFTTVRQVKDADLVTPHYVPYTLGIAKTSGVATAIDITAASGWGTGTMVGFTTPVSGSPAMVVTGSDLAANVFAISAQFNIPVEATAPIGVYTDAVVVGINF